MSDRIISNHFLKLSGKAELPKAIEMGHNYHISIEGSVNTTQDSDNEDGTYTRAYTFKAIKIELLDQKGEALKLKDTRSNSQLIRSLLYKKWVNAASDVSFDEFYDAACRAMMANIDLIIDWAEKFRDNK